MLTALLLAVALVPQTPTAARRPAPPPKPPVITVQARAQVTVPAEEAILSIGVTAHDSSAVAAARASARTLHAVLDTLAALGFTADSLPTADYELRRPQPWEGGRHHRKGYVAENSITVTVTDLKRVGEVLDAVVARGANDVPDITFDVADRSVPRRLALAKAMNRAREDAEQMAKSAGGRLGRILSVTNASDPYGFLSDIARDANANVHGGAPVGFQSLGHTPITAPTVTVNAVVQVKWELIE